MHAGTPQKDSDFFKYDLKGTPFYIHNDLLERQIEVFTSGSSPTGSRVEVDYQYIHTLKFDVYGNAIETAITRKEFSGSPDSAKATGMVIDYRETAYDFTNSTEVQKRKGIAGQIITHTWTGPAKALLVDIQRTLNNNFDSKGNVLNQQILTYKTEAGYINGIANEQTDIVN